MQAIEMALARNPELIAASYEIKAADARITQSALRPNPEVSVALENFAGSGAACGTGALETTLKLAGFYELIPPGDYGNDAAVEANHPVKDQ